MYGEINEISVSFVLHRENFRQAEEMIKLSEKLSVDVVYFHNMNTFDSDKFNTLKKSDKDVKKYFDKLRKKRDYKIKIYLPALYDNRKTFCLMPFTDMLFNYNGDISPCCHLMDFSYGNINDESEVWHGDKIKEFRDQFFIKNQELHPNCKYCHRRFETYSCFNEKLNKWSSTKPLVKKIKTICRKVMKM